jgi:hypothetical protein
MHNRIFITCLVAIYTMSLRAQPLVGKHQPTVLLEMFSSEGCSSCAIASEFLGQINRLADSTESPVYILDYHVDVWNKSGWIDPYSKSEYTLRQEMYMEKLGVAALFTPMMIINGKMAMAGGERQRIGRAIASELGSPAHSNLYIEAMIDSEKSAIKIQYEIATDMPNDSLYLVLVLAQRRVESRPTAGENKDKQLVHHHVVSDMKILEPVEKKAVTIFDISDQIFSRLSDYALIAYLQNKNTWQVLTTDELLFVPKN